MSLRTWATPLTMGFFLLLAVTGVAMFFHIETPLNKLLHEWLGWALLAAVGAHLWLNRRPLSAYLKRPMALTIMGAAIVILLASFMLPTPGAGPVPVRAALGSLAQAPISTLASLAGTDPAVLLSKLAADHPGARAEQSLADLTGGDVQAALGLLALAYPPEAP